MYFGEVPVGVSYDPLGSHYTAMGVHSTPEMTLDPRLYLAGGEQWTRSRSTTVETRFTVTTRTPSLRRASTPETGEATGLWARITSWVKKPRRGADSVADESCEASENTTIVSASGTSSELGAAEVVTTTVTETKERRFALWRPAVESNERALVRATKEIVRVDDREEEVFGDCLEPRAEKQTYKQFVQIEYMRGRKRGSRGLQRPYRAKRIEYCSLLEHAVRLMSDPNFKFSAAELADVYRELMAVHKREGCELGFKPKRAKDDDEDDDEGNKELIYEKVGPGGHPAMVASHVRESLCPGSGFVQAQFKMVRKEVAMDMRAMWEIHWAANENRTKPTVGQRIKLNWWGFQNWLGLSVPLPPRQ